jgi:polyphosphate kinase
MISAEIRAAKNKKKASITLKVNSLSDEELIFKLYEAARAGVELRLIVRGIFCMLPENKKFRKPVTAISILDEYLEHARVFIFHNHGKEKVYISSADWMVRNMDHRVEATCPVTDTVIRKELKEILDIQLADNVKARWLDNGLQNRYKKDQSRKVRSQIEIYQYLNQKNIKPAPETADPGEVPVPGILIPL